MRWPQFPERAPDCARKTLRIIFMLRNDTEAIIVADHTWISPSVWWSTCKDLSAVLFAHHGDDESLKPFVLMLKRAVLVFFLNAGGKVISERPTVSMLLNGAIFLERLRYYLCHLFKLRSKESNNFYLLKLKSSRFFSHHQVSPLKS